jgi:hypothetical protein
MVGTVENRQSMLNKIIFSSDGLWAVPASTDHDTFLISTVIC